LSPTLPRFAPSKMKLAVKSDSVKSRQAGPDVRPQVAAGSLAAIPAANTAMNRLFS
jgi:hypothetical protein